MAAIKKIIKMQAPAGKATPAPPFGTMLGPQGINIQQFCLQYNEATKDKIGSIVPVEITIYEDRTFTFKLKTPPASDLIKKAAGVEKGSATPLTGKVGSITKQQLKEIAEIKRPDLNANDIDGAMNIITGTARNMGITIKD